MKKKVPAYNGTLRDHTIMCPYCISECSGIRIFGKRIKSIAFSTDVAIIKNINADAIIAVYPFTPQAAISQSIIGSTIDLVNRKSEAITFSSVVWLLCMLIANGVSKLASEM